MTTMSKIVATFAIVSVAAGCDWLAAKELKEDRNERLYKAAMADYSAGRIDAAVSGFEKTLRANPGNSSARFQLASLLQDHRRDYLAAMCQYREFLLQSPDSDKSNLARERAEVCERQYAAHLLNQMKDGEGPVAKEIERLRTNAQKDAQEIARLKVELEAAIAERDSAKRECELTRNLVRSLGEEEGSNAPSFDMASAKELLDEEEIDPPKFNMAKARALLDEEDDEGVDRVKFSADVRNLIADEENETKSTPFAVAEKKSQDPVESGDSGTVSDKENASKEPQHEPRPDKYVVQEGDTLYKIALRFYGKRSAWLRIRDANKTVISTDGRVNAGATITLPK